MMICRDDRHCPLCDDSCEAYIEVVPQSVFEQVKWERDVAFEQLREAGLKFGEKTASVMHSYWESYSCSQFMGTDEWGEPKWRDGKFYVCHNRKCRRKTVVKSNYCPTAAREWTVKNDMLYPCCHLCSTDWRNSSYINRRYGGNRYMGALRYRAAEIVIQERMR